MSGRKKGRVLIADDDEGIVWVLRELLEGKGLDVVTAGDGERAAAMLRQGGVDLAILDIRMPGKDGLSVLRETDCDGAVVIMTAESTMKNTMEAIRRGAFDYITKPFDTDEVEIIVDRALESVRLRREVSSLKDRLKQRLSDETTYIGRSRAVQGVFKTVAKVAPQDVTVLIQGESGTGKELLARIIHANSPRCDGPFVAVNSAAIPRELMESELFGAERGAYTGATERRKGKFELADGGTIFLDEIGDMSLGLQARLLRAIQEREFYRVGGTAPVRVDVRIVAATNHDLEEAVRRGTFREDLLYRLNVVTVTLPPLRRRKGDIPLLCEYFLDKFARQSSVERKRLSEDAVAELEKYRWPGNVRELENVLRRAVLLSPSVVISADELALPQRRNAGESLEDVITRRLEPLIEKTPLQGGQDLYDMIIPFMERPLIKLVLRKTGGNQVKAAELLGINRNTLRKKVKELKIDLKKIKSG
ncbi:MAG TPA: sigma-54-dependent Fis family transcriptional regulator [Deltaproteobacteria bacterium]|nr:sigma-54-dependent Fis family transcriptional regulator [Deltaproteobacteria bacterium]